jgi:hypothetical protein
MNTNTCIEIQAKNTSPDCGQTMSVPIEATGPYCAWVIKES